MWVESKETPASKICLLTTLVLYCTAYVCLYTLYTLCTIQWFPKTLIIDQTPAGDM